MYRATTLVHLLGVHVPGVAHDQLASALTALDHGAKRNGLRIQGDLHAQTRPLDDKQWLVEARTLQEYLQYMGDQKEIYNKKNCFFKSFIFIILLFFNIMKKKKKKNILLASNIWIHLVNLKQQTNPTQTKKKPTKKQQHQ